MIPPITRGPVALKLARGTHRGGGNNPHNREFPSYTPTLEAALRRRKLNFPPSSEHPLYHANRLRVLALYNIRSLERECGVVDSWE